MYSLADRAAIRNGNTMEGGEGDFTSQWGLPVTPVNTIAAAEQRRLGQDRFHAGENVSECQNAHQRNGFWAACDAAADAETYRYLSSGGAR